MSVQSYIFYFTSWKEVKLEEINMLGSFNFEQHKSKH